MAPQEEPVSPPPSKRWTQFYAALQLAIQRAAHKWTSVLLSFLPSRNSQNISLICLVIKTFPSVSPSGVRNNPTVQRVSLTQSQALSKPTSSYVSLPFPCLLSSIHTHPNDPTPLVISLPFPPGARHRFILPLFRFGMGTLDQYKQVVRAIRCPKKRGYFAPSGD
jgi:hypothetical protein